MVDRHAISRYIADFGATVRLPVHMGRSSPARAIRVVPRGGGGDASTAGDAARARLDRVVGNIPAWSLRGPCPCVGRPRARGRRTVKPLPALEIDAIAADVEDLIQRLEEARAR